MMPLSPDRGFTLEEKEKHYFDSADGALFIITPGSERFGLLFPSLSVIHEMGQAKQKFQKKPQCVIYLVDKECNQNDTKLTNLLEKKYNLSIQDINFLKRDLISSGVAIHRITDEPHYMNLWWLSGLGWAVVRLEAEKKKKAEREAMGALAEILAHRRLSKGRLLP